MKDWELKRRKAERHAALMRERPELRETLYGSMSPAVRRMFLKPDDRPNILQRARDREIGLDKLYPSAKQRNEET